MSDIYRVTYVAYKDRWAVSGPSQVRFYEDQIPLQRDLVKAHLDAQLAKGWTNRDARGLGYHLLQAWKDFFNQERPDPETYGRREAKLVEKRVGDEWVPMQVQFFPPEVRIEEA